MRLRNIRGSKEKVDGCPLVVQDAERYRGAWRELFGNDRPIYIEVGMGKGRFLREQARMHPDINYVGIERYTSALVRALGKVEENPPANLLFLRMDAVDLEKVFGEGEVSGIYLNFSDPWPKKRHAGRRLPSRGFLARYDRILKRDGRLEFKTDNRELFEFALGELPAAGWKVEQMTYDLHRDAEMRRDNVMTEYEEKFTMAGVPICKYIIYR